MHRIVHRQPVMSAPAFYSTPPVPHSMSPGCAHLRRLKNKVMKKPRDMCRRQPLHHQESSSERRWCSADALDHFEVLMGIDDHLLLCFTVRSAAEYEARLVPGILKQEQCLQQGNRKNSYHCPPLVFDLFLRRVCRLKVPFQTSTIKSC